MAKDYFTKEEKTCHCGCGLNLVDRNPRFLQMLNSARELYGKPMVATSMTRCKKHNKAVGGAAASEHLNGLAADIRCSDYYERLAMLEAFWIVGFRRFEISAVHIHVDFSATKRPFLGLFLNGKIV